MIEDLISWNEWVIDRSGHHFDDYLIGVSQCFIEHLLSEEFYMEFPSIFEENPVNLWKSSYRQKNICFMFGTFQYGDLYLSEVENSFNFTVNFDAFRCWTSLQTMISWRGHHLSKRPLKRLGYISSISFYIYDNRGYYVWLQHAFVFRWTPGKVN